MARRRPVIPSEDFSKAASSRSGARDEVVIGTGKVAGGRGAVRGDGTGPRRRTGSRANPRAQYNDTIPGYTPSRDLNIVRPSDDLAGEYADEFLSGRTGRGGMAPQTVIPTNTTNKERPRTLTAGYDRQSQTLSVVFRDGTSWNYYGVTYQMWTAFKASPSPGRYIRTRLDFKAYGPPNDSSDIDPSEGDLLAAQGDRNDIE